VQVSRIIAEIDAQILKLQQARALLAEGLQTEQTRRGRPKGSTNTPKPAAGGRKRKMTAEGRKRIADAMKKRWAERRKQGGGK
jgi:hypothetical protein